ncbi:hypothetical protein LBMAG42_34250 [Deltaproteobacteria bacterium]|nr:hypothetical protein LBMAG42_34250 [Deltaproteobacteria bacterium]
MGAAPAGATEPLSQESMTRLKELIRTAEVDDETRAEMILRLANLYVEEGRVVYAGEMEAGSEDHAASQVWIERSIKLFEQITARYPQFARADEAGFALGQARIELANVSGDSGQRVVANTELTKLVKQFPQSRFAADAYLLIGEFWFDQNEPSKALIAYQHAVADPNFERRTFARYKLAWVWYNLGEFDQATVAMKTVVSESVGEGNRIKLREEALHDLVRFFADQGDLDAAWDYFQGIGEPALFTDCVERLAAIYAEQGKFDAAVVTLRRLIVHAPVAASAPAHQAEIVHLMVKMGRAEDAWLELERLRTMVATASGWSRANASHPDVVATARGTLEAELRSFAVNTGLSREGRHSAARRELSDRAFAAYFTEVSHGEHEADMRYAWAELLYGLKRFDAAYDQYMAVVSLEENGAHTSFCAESAVFAADELLKRERKAGTAPTGVGPKPLTSAEGKLLAALDQYTRIPGGDPVKVRAAIYRSGYLLYERDQFKEAAVRFRTVIGLDPQSREAEQAAHLILDSFALTKDWDNLEETSRAFLAEAGLGSPAFKAEIRQVYESARIEGVEARLLRTGDKATAVVEYLVFQEEFPASTHADLALHDAGVYLTELGRPRDAIRARERLVEQYPKSKYAADEMAVLGFAYESLADFRQAATWYERLVATQPSHPAAADALYSAAVLRWSLGQGVAAIGDYTRFVQGWPQHPAAHGARLEIAGLLEANGRPAEASQAWLAIFAPPRGAPPEPWTADEVMHARLRFGRLFTSPADEGKQAQHWKDSLAWYQAAKVRGEGGSTAAEAAAEMSFRLAERAFGAALSLRIDGPGDRPLPGQKVDRVLSAQLVAKARAMQEVEATYTDVIEIGSVAWAMESLVRQGQAQEQFADTIERSYVPAYLTAAQQEIYRMKLQDMAWQMRQKAAAFYVAALDKSRELGWYGPASVAASARLSVLAPEAFPPAFEILPEPRFVATVERAGRFERGD